MLSSHTRMVWGGGGLNRAGWARLAQPCLCLVGCWSGKYLLEVSALAVEVAERGHVACDAGAVREVLRHGVGVGAVDVAQVEHPQCAEPRHRAHLPHVVNAIALQEQLLQRGQLGHERERSDLVIGEPARTAACRHHRC
jgi:hypothetical protein